MSSKKKPGPWDGVPRPPVTSKTALITWADKQVGASPRFLVRSRLVVAHDGRVEDMTARVPADLLDATRIVQVAAVLFRQVEPRDFVGALFLAKHSAGAGHPSVTRSTLLGWSPAGGGFCKSWETRPNAYRMVETTVHEANRRLSFGEPEFVVDPGVEDALARVGFPGAVERSSSWEPAGPPEAWEVAPTYLHISRSQPWPWESARNVESNLKRIALSMSLEPTPVAWRPFHPVPPDSSPRYSLHGGFHTDEEVAGFTAFLSTGMDPVETTAILVRHPSVTPRLRLGLLAWGLQAAHERKVAKATRLLPPLLACAYNELSRVGGIRGWIAEQWPERLGTTNTVGPWLIGSMSSALSHKAAIAQDRVALDESIALLEEFRDALLDRADAPPGPAGARVAELSHRVTRGSSTVPTRLVRYAQLVMQSSGDIPTHFLEVAGFHAALLHSQVAILRMIAATGQLGGETGDLDCEAHLEGVFDEARAAQARLVVTYAAHLSEKEPDQALELLSLAARLAAFEPAVMGCVNEGRYRLGVRTDALLADLEGEAPSLGRTAEALTVAEELRSPRRSALTRQLLAAPKDTPALRWGAAIRAMGFRPEPMSEIERVRTLLRERPPLPTGLSGTRAGYALYGPDPAATLKQWVTRLQGQEAALVEANALRIERIEEQLTRPPPPRKERPSVPSATGPGAVEAALDAVRWRLSRPAAGNLALRKEIHAHLRDALRLQAAESERNVDVDAWLAALGTADVGLVPILDHVLRTGDETQVPVALGLAREACEQGVQDAWALATREQLGQIASAVAGAGGVFARELDAAWAAFGVVRGVDATASARAGVDDLLAALRLRLAERRDDEEYEDDERPTGLGLPAVGFQSMRVEPDALLRSRGELDTPEWAIQTGLRQVDLFNQARGRRDLKKLQGTAAGEKALFELRHRDARHPVRVLWRYGLSGPAVVAIMVKDDGDDQRRILERVQQWGPV